MWRMLKKMAFSWLGLIFFFVGRNLKTDYQKLKAKGEAARVLPLAKADVL